MTPYCIVTVINNGIKEIQYFFNVVDSKNIDMTTFQKVVSIVPSDNFPPFIKK